MREVERSFLLLKLVLFFLLFLNGFRRTVRAQSLPPARQEGFVYTDHRVDSDTIMIEAFFDPVCPDSRDSWGPLKQAIEHYGSRVWLVVHLLPLPYHDNAFVASRALHVVNKLDASATFLLMESFFKRQARFYNAQTQNMTKVAVVNDIIKFTAEAIGNSYYSAIRAAFSDTNTDLQTRISFKYSTSRGVYGTPTFFVNGFVLPDAGSTIDYKGWRSVIDPLIAAQVHKKGKTLPFSF